MRPALAAAVILAGLAAPACAQDSPLMRLLERDAAAPSPLLSPSPGVEISRAIEDQTYRMEQRAIDARAHDAMDRERDDNRMRDIERQQREQQFEIDRLRAGRRY